MKSIYSIFSGITICNYTHIYFGWIKEGWNIRKLTRKGG